MNWPGGCRVSLPGLRNNDKGGPSLAALLDGELAPSDQQQLEQHLAICPHCRADLARQRLARLALRRLSVSLSAPSGQRSQARLALERRAPAGRKLRRLVLFGGMAATVILALAAWNYMTAPVASPDLLARVVLAHQQVTEGPAPVSLATSNPDLVATWARSGTGKNFEVPSLEAAGYHLLGARTEPDVAPGAITLVYERNGVRATCTVLPASGPLLTRLALPPAVAIHQTSIRGSNAASWRDRDTIYVLVADLDMQALLHLARLAAQSG